MICERPFLCLFALKLLIFTSISFASGGESNKTSYPQAQPSIFSNKEINWISEHPVIIAGVDYDFVPFEFINSGGQHEGICADYLDIVRIKTGLSIEIHQESNWSTVVEKAKAREIDILPCVGMTSERKKFMHYSTPHQSFYRAVVTKNDAAIGNKLQDFDDYRVGVQRNSSHHGFIVDNSTIQPTLFDTAEQAIIALSNGEVDVVIGNENTSTYIINTNSIINLKMERLAGSIEKNLYFAIRKDWPILRSIINKTLNSISKEQKEVIARKWFSSKPESRFDSVVIYSVITVLSVVLIIFIIWGFYARRQHKRTMQVARRDQLTGLYNRHYLHEVAFNKLSLANNADADLSLMMLDVDHFKVFNDTYGHLAGDKVLQAVATELLKHCRKDDIVFRYGGEEFIVLIFGANLFQAELKAESIREMVEQLQIQETQITCSIGVAEYGAEDKNIEDLIHRADKALYQAKEAGRNRVISSQNLPD